MPQRPNILYLMCDQFRFDCIAAQGNPYVATPNLDRLVREGYLMRQPVAGDRRKTELVCTPQAQDAICRGRQLQEMFFDRLLDGMDDGMRLQLLTALETISKNLDALLKEAE